MQSAYKLFLSAEQPKELTDLQLSDFTLWTSSYQYRTAYGDMSSSTHTDAKRCAIPGYSGYIPGATSDNTYGKTFAQIAKEQLNREKFLPERLTEVFPYRPYRSMDQGLGKYGGGLPDEYHTITRFHGQSTIPCPHPNVSPSGLQTSYSASWNPGHLQSYMLYRNSKSCKNYKVSNKPITQASGFNANNALTHGFSPIKQQKVRVETSEYRSKFGRDVPFHPRPLGTSIRQLKKIFGNK